MCKRVGGVSSGIRVRVRVMWVTSRARHQSVDDQHQATSTSLFFAKGGWQKFLTRSKGQRRRALWCFHAVVHYHPHTSYSVLFLPSRFGHHIVLLHWCGSSSLHVLLPEFSALLSFDLAICSTSIGWLLISSLWWQMLLHFDLAFRLCCFLLMICSLSSLKCAQATHFSQDYGYDVTHAKRHQVVLFVPANIGHLMLLVRQDDDYRGYHFEASPPLPIFSAHMRCL